MTSVCLCLTKLFKFNSLSESEQLMLDHWVMVTSPQIVIYCMVEDQYKMYTD